MRSKKSPRFQRSKLRSRVSRIEQLEARRLLVSDWQNPHLAFDVNNDLMVSPTDALLIINRLNSSSQRLLTTSHGSLQPYLDTNGDRLVSPSDVLRVVNVLNDRGKLSERVLARIEGEAATAPAGFLSIPIAQLPGEAGQVVPLSTTLSIGREEFNEMGIFVADDASGRVGGIMPGDPGYAEAVFNSTQRRVLYSRFSTFRTDSESNLPAGSYAHVYVLQSTSDHSNPIEHLRSRQVSTNKLNVGWEEHVSLFSGWTQAGDRSYDDANVDFEIGEPFDGNAEPVLRAIPNQTIDELKQLATDALAADADMPGDVITYSLDVAPPGAAINSTTGRITWTPSEQQGPGNFEFIVRATDSIGAFDTESFFATVLEVNQAPVLAPIQDMQVEGGKVISLDLSATDLDLPANTLSFSLQNDAPAGASIDPVTGRFVWATTVLPFNTTFPITVIVNDNGSPRLSHSRTFSVTVTQPRLCSFDSSLNGWSVFESGGTSNGRGSVSSDGCSATIQEGDSFVVGIEKTFVVPSTSSGVQFTYETPKFDTTDTSSIRDAFEVAIVDQFGSPIVPPFAVGRDAYFNVTEGMPVTVTPGVQLNGKTVIAGLVGVPTGTIAKVIFRMANNDSDTKSEVSISYFDVLPGDAPLARFTGSGELNLPTSPTAIFNSNSNQLKGGSGNTNGAGQNSMGGDAEGGFSANLEWQLSSFAVAPQSKQIGGTPMVADVDRDGMPDIVVVTHATTNGSQSTGNVLRLIRGDGTVSWSITDEQFLFTGGSQIAVGNIDNDEQLEILVASGAHYASSLRLLAFEHDGTFKWQSPSLAESIGWGGPSIADLDADGVPEVIVGSSALNSTDGSIRWNGKQKGGTGAGGIGFGTLSSVVDLDRDGQPEVLAGNSAYRANGDLYWNSTAPDGYTAIGNFDNDLFPEIALVSNGSVYLLEHNGQVKWGPKVIPGGGRGGPPTIADVDNDGLPEIGVAGAAKYVVYESDGSVRWQQAIQDGSSNFTGSSVFDFDGNGTAEIVYGDELYLRVFNGADGQVLYELKKSSCTALEYPVVVDVDADGKTEIVAVANQDCGFGSQNGIFVLGNDAWVSTRQIWNQHTYHITNINDDGTVPRVEPNGWEVYNNYRRNLQPTGTQLGPPVISVSSPDTSFAVGTHVVLSGVSTAQGTRTNGEPNRIESVFLNNQPVDVLDVNGRFYTRVAILAGENQLSFTATDSVGQTVSTTLVLNGVDSNSPIDFSRFVDISSNFSGAYFRTSFNESAKLLNVDLATKNNGQFSSEVPLLVGVKNLSDPTVSVLGADYIDEQGVVYYDYSQEVSGGRLVPGGLSESPTVQFYNPNRVQFTYDLVFYGKVNEAPFITTVPTIEAISGKVYRYDVDAIDPNGDALTYTLTSSPTGMTIHSGSGLIDWNPTASQIGLNDVTVQVTDGRGGTAEQRFTVSTITAPPNRPPVITSEPITVAHVVRRSQVTEVDLTEWTTHTVADTYGNGDDQPNVAPNWQVSSDGFSVKQLRNANASMFLSDFDVADQRIYGQWKVDDTGAAGFVDDDFMGFVFGYQDPQHFYLFDWKAASQSFHGASASRGMTVKRIDADSPLQVADLWATSGNSSRVSSLYHNNIGWTNHTDYSFDLTFENGQFTIRVMQGTTELDTIQINDDRYTSGKFGFYNYSQGEVTYQGFLRSTSLVNSYYYDVAAFDPDQDTLSYALKSSPQGMNIDSSTGQIRWSPNADQVGDHRVKVEVTDGRGGSAIQEFSVCVEPDPLNHAPVIVSTPSTTSDSDQTYRPEISRTTNPTGNWSWGWKAAGQFTNSALSLYDATDLQFGKAGWLSTQAAAGSANASFNDTSAPITIPNIGTFQPGDISLHPGNAGQASVLRFIAPEAGQYSIQFGVSRIDTGNTTGYLITKNGILFQGTSVGGSQYSTPSPIALSAGDFIDFAVAGQYVDGNTKVTPVITRLADATQTIVRRSSTPQDVAIWPSSSGGNNHAYRVVQVPAGITWTDAEQAARAAGGHLASIESAAENSFVYSLASNSAGNWHSDGTNTSGPWLGGLQASDSVEPGQGWKWVTGGNLTYTNWSANQPNNGGGVASSEEVLVFGGQGTNNPSDRWNDLPKNYLGVTSYVVEFEVDSPIINFLYDVQAVDPDADQLTYALVEGPAGMEIDPSTGQLHWQPPISPNLLSNGSFEQVGSVSQGQGVLPTGWVNISTISPAADLWSDDGSAGLNSSSSNNWLTTAAQDGHHFMAGTHFGGGDPLGGAGNYEGFGQALAASLQPGTQYSASAYIQQFVNSTPSRDYSGGYEIWIAQGPSISTNALKVASLPATTRQSNWEQSKATFRTPSTLGFAMTHVILIPYATDPNNTVYPAIDNLKLYRDDISRYPVEVEVTDGRGGSDKQSFTLEVGTFSGSIAGTVSSDFPGPRTVTIYEEDFEDASDQLSEWSQKNVSVTPIGGRRFLGDFGAPSNTVIGESASLTLNGLPEHDSLHLSFDLFLLRTWDGNGPDGPDIWKLAIRDGQTLINTTFSNSLPTGIRRQAYPGSYPTDSNDPRTGASENNTLGYVWEGQPSDSVYHFEIDLSHSSSSIVLDFSTPQLTWGLEESWGLDNVKITTGDGVYKNSDGFSVLDNPNGPWTFGYKTSGSSANQFTPFSLNLDPTQLLGPPIVGWTGTAPGIGGTFPSTAFNPGNSIYDLPAHGLAIAPKQVVLHPGPNGEVSINRFVVPDDGLYSISAIFDSVDSQHGTTDVHILVDGQSIFDSIVTNAEVNYQKDGIALLTGQTVDFAVGNGGNGYLHDLTSLDATITQLAADLVGQPNVVVYLDQNQNSRRDPSEQFTVSKSSYQNGSTFDNGAEGWSVGPGATQSAATTGGNPGGYFKLVDTDGTNLMKAVVPTHLLNNLSQFDNGILSFDTKIISLSGPPLNGFPPFYDDFGIVTITTKFGETIAIDGVTTNPAQEWTRHQVPLSAQYWGKSQEEWERVLSEVQSINITLESHYGVIETIGLDNVQFQTQGGDYSFTNLPPGEYLVRQEVPQGWRMISPPSGVHTVELANNQSVTGIDFVNTPTDDLANHQPTIAAQPSPTAIVDQPLLIEMLATDSDSDPLNFSLLSSPSGMTIHPSLGVLVWQPTEGQVGTHQAVVQVSDGRGGTASQLIDIMVTLPNAAPVFTSALPKQAVVGRSITVDVAVQDADDANVLITLAPGSVGTLVEIPRQTSNGTALPSSYRFQWTPTTTDLAAVTRTITLEARDGRGGLTVQAQSIQVLATLPNQSPVIESTPPGTAYPNLAYIYKVKARDPDGHTLRYSLQDQPPGMTVSSEGVITWTPTSTVGLASPILLTVVDDFQGVATQSISVTLSDQHQNGAPSITSNPRLAAREGRLYSYDAVADDPQGDTLLWTLEDAPSGMSIDPEQGRIRWIPREDQMGSHSVTVRVTDPLGATSVQLFSIDVACVNSPPLILSTPLTQAFATETYIYGVRAFDPDGDSVSFSLLSPPVGMTIGNSGTIRWIPSASDAGQSISIVVRATDVDGDIALQTYQLAVESPTNRNRPPVITSVPIYNATTGSPYTYTVAAIDPDGDAITYQLKSPPSGMTIHPNTGVIAWTPAASTTVSIIVEARDPSGAIATQGYQLAVKDNQAPVITSQPITVTVSGGVYRYGVRATDADNDRLSYHLTNAPSGMQIDELGQISWNVPADLAASGNIDVPIEIVVADPRQAQATQAFNLTVTPDNQPPAVSLQIVAATGSFSNNAQVDLGSLVTLRVVATDNVGVAQRSLLIDGQATALNSFGEATFLASQLGSRSLVASAVDIAGNETEQTGQLGVVLPGSGTDPSPNDPSLPTHPGFDPSDTTRPTVTITSPTVGESVTNSVAIKGTIDDPEDNLWYWRAYYAKLDSINVASIDLDDPDLVQIAQGTNEVLAGTIATFDPSKLDNDAYAILVAGFDVNGKGYVAATIVNVEGNLKLGQFHLEFVDLSLPLAGIPIQVTRVYDTRQANREGDFGYGWTLGVQDARILEVAAIGQGGALNGGNDKFIPDKTKVYLTNPAGQRVGFTYKERLVTGSLFGAIYAPYFVADPGVYDTLSIDETQVARGGIIGALSQGINPENYNLTTKEGLKYRYHDTQGLKTITDRNGNVVTFTENGITHSSGVSIDFIRDHRGRIKEIQAPQAAGQPIVIRYEYDQGGDLRQYRSPTDAATTFNYFATPKHYLQSAFDTLGRKALDVRYENGVYVGAFDANNNQIDRREYDNDAHTAVVRDGNGNATTFIYNNRGNVIREIDALSNETLREYTDPTNPDKETQVVDRNGNVTSYKYDSRGNTTEIKDSFGIRSLSYNSQNQLIRSVDEDGHATAISYDAAGNLAKITNAAGHSTIMVYDSRGRATSVTDARGATATFAYVGNSTQPSEVHNADDSPSNPSVRLFEYNAYGQTTKSTDEEGHVTVTNYNNSGQVVYEKTGNDAAVEYYYTGHLQTRRVIRRSIAEPGKSDIVTEFGYWPNDRLRFEIDALGGVTGYEYDPAGNRTFLGRWNSKADYDSDYTAAQTDQSIFAGRFPKATFEHVFVYDQLGRVDYEVDDVQLDLAERAGVPINQIAIKLDFQYDANGNTSKIIDRNGRVRAFEYDERDRQAMEQWFSDVNDTSPDRSLVWSYCSCGAVEEATEYAAEPITSEVLSHYVYTHDSLRRVTSVDNVGTKDMPRVILIYSYDANGNRISVSDNLGVAVKSTYDNRNRLDRRWWENTTSVQAVDEVMVDFDYYKNGEEKELRRYSDKAGTDLVGRTLYASMDASGRIRTISHRDSLDQILAEYNYSFDQLGLVDGLEYDNATLTKDGVADPYDFLVDYQYDDLGQLTAADYSNATTTRGIYVDEFYQYDKNGNRVDSYLHPRSAQTDGTSYETGTGHRLLSDGTNDYRYDNEGNMIRKTSRVTGEVTVFEYDHRNRLTRATVYSRTPEDAGIITSESTNRYDIDGRRIEFTVDENGAIPGELKLTRVVHNGDDTWADLDNGSNDILLRYLAGTKVDQLLVSFSHSASLEWYLSDGIRTIRDSMTENEGLLSRSYGSFGIQIANSETRFTFTGREPIVGFGIIWYRSRAFDVSVGRFQSTDPISFTSAEVNLFQYGKNSPQNFIDPFGHNAIAEFALISVPLAGFGSVVGAYAGFVAYGTFIAKCNNHGIQVSSEQRTKLWKYYRDKYVEIGAVGGLIGAAGAAGGGALVVFLTVGVAVLENFVPGFYVDLFERLEGRPRVPSLEQDDLALCRDGSL